MIYYFYRITYKDYPHLNYVGSTNNFNKRKLYHKEYIKNNDKRKIYKFINSNNINFNDLEFTIISQFNLKSKEHSFKHERYWIEKYNSIKQGQNERIPYVSKNEKKEQQKKYNEENKYYHKNYTKNY